MKSSQHGKNISVPEIEIGNISSHGVWVLVRDEEYFLSYRDFPWFEQARVSDINNVELVHRNHLYWPSLDVDLHLDSLKNPHHFPLVS